ncbi:MAG: MFS transporter [Pseudomonadota bacterium]
MSLSVAVLKSTLLLLATVAIVGANSLSLGPIAPGIAADLNAPLSAVLAASAAYGIGTAASAFLLAPAIDRIGVKTCLLRSVLVLFVAFGLSTLANGSEWLTGAQLLAGIGAGVALPATYACVPAIAPPRAQSQAMGIVLTGWTISMVAGVGLAAVAADYISWRVVYAVLCTLCGFIALGIARSELPNQPTQKKAGAQLDAIRVPGAALLLSVVGCYMVAFYGVYNYLGDHVVSTLQRPLSANAWISICYGVGFGLAATADKMIDKLTGSAAYMSRLPTLAMGVLAVVYLLLAAINGNYTALLATALIWGMVNHLVLNILLGALNRVDPSSRGSILGLYSCITYVALSVATLGYGVIYSHSALALLCLVSTVLCLAGAVLAVRYTPPTGTQSEDQ